MNNYREIMDRLKLYFQVNSDRKIAEKLGINYNTIKTWSNRGKIPIEKLLIKFQNEPINLNWLLTGKGEMFLKDNSSVAIQNSNIIGHSNIIGNNNSIENTPNTNQPQTTYLKELTEAFTQLPPEKQKLYYHKFMSELYNEILKQNDK